MPIWYQNLTLIQFFLKFWKLNYIYEVALKGLGRVYARMTCIPWKKERFVFLSYEIQCPENELRISLESS
jgi:hypothetical protein